MKKKIVVLLLLILAGMWIFLSQNGRCALAPWWTGHQPWDEQILCSPGPGNDPNDNDVNINTDNSQFINISIFEAENLLRRRDESLDNFQQKQGNSGQVK